MQLTLDALPGAISTAESEQFFLSVITGSHGQASQAACFHWLAACRSGLSAMRKMQRLRSQKRTSNVPQARGHRPQPATRS